MMVSPLRRVARFAPCALVLGLTLASLPYDAQHASAIPRTGDTLPPHVPDEVLVKFRSGSGKTSRAQAQAIVDGHSMHRFRTGAEHWKLGRGVDVETAIERLSRRADVEYAEPNYLVEVARTPDDPLFNDMYSLRNTGQTGGRLWADIHAEEAWDLTTGSRDVVVAVTDTGIDYRHPDLEANIWINPGEIEGNGIDDDNNGFVDDVRGWDFVSNDNDPFDNHRHGTHVAGIIGAQGNNGTGTVGVCWQVRLMSVKFLDSQGWGTYADAVKSVEYATDMGASIINASWGGYDFSKTLYDAIHEAGERQVLFVAAAGNYSRNMDLDPMYPAAFSEPAILSVAATDASDQVAWFSNYGQVTVDMAAPGVDVLSTLPNGLYGFLSGTSMAAPHVSGAAALVRSLLPNLPVPILKQLLMDQGDLISGDPLGRHTATDRRLNAFRAVPQADLSPPGQVMDLEVVQVSATTVLLRWTATGDDGVLGRASRYDVRFSTGPLDDLSFLLARSATGAPDLPSPSGEAEEMRIVGLTPGTTYQLGLRVEDEFGNVGGLSNVVSATTLEGPMVPVSPSAFDVELSPGQTETRHFSLMNNGDETVQFRITRDTGPDGIVDQFRNGQWESASAAGSRTREITEEEPSTTRRDGSQGRLPGPLNAEAGSLRPGISILMVGGDGADPDPVREGLLTFPEIAQVDQVHAFERSLERLLRYDAVLIDVDGSDEFEADLLADYIDRGGSVVLTLPSFLSSYYGESHPIGGRFSYEGYMPMLGTGLKPQSASLGAFDPGHPIMHGIAEVFIQGRSDVTLAEGADLVASFNDGMPFVATARDRVVAINSYLGLPEYWEGDLLLLVHNALLWSQGHWLKLPAPTGTVPPHTLVEVPVVFDATALTAGSYAASLHLETSDPDLLSTEIPARLTVTGEPELVIDRITQDFGGVVVGASGAGGVTLWNRGTRILHVTSISLDRTVFSLERTSLVLVPGQKRTIGIQFSPTGAGPVTGHLLLESDDPDQPAVTAMLTGQGLAPPEMQLSASEISAVLNPGGSVTKTLSIHNAGEGVLSFTASLRDASVEPTGPGVASLPAALLVQDFSPSWGSSIERVLQANAIAFRQIRTSELSDTNLDPFRMVIVPTGHFQTGNPTLLSQMPRLESFVRQGGVLEVHASDIWGFGEGLYGRLTVLPGGMRVLPYGTGLNWIADPLHPIMAGLGDPIAGMGVYGPYTSGCYFSGIPPAASRITTDDLGRINLVAYPLGSGLVIAACQTLEDGFAFGRPTGTILSNMIAFAHGFVPSWASIPPTAGTIPPGGSQNLTVALSARGAGNSTFNSRLEILSNDPRAPQISIPISMQVRALPALEILGDEALVESALPMQAVDGGSLHHALRLDSGVAGSGELEITLFGDFGQSGEMALIDSEGNLLGVMRDSLVTDKFVLTPALLAQVSADGTINVSVLRSPEVDTDLCFPDPCWTIARLRYRRSVKALSFDLLDSAERTSRSMLLENRGTSPLLISAVEATPPFSASPSSMLILPGDRAELDVAFLPPGVGDYTGTLRLLSNDPARPEVVLPLSAKVSAAPTIHATPAAFQHTVVSGRSLLSGLRLDNGGDADLDFAIEVLPASESSGTPACNPFSTLAVGGYPGRMLKIDTATGTLTPLAEGLPSLGALALSTSGRSAYVTAPSEGTLSRIDLRSGMVSEVTRANIPTYGAPGMALRRDESLAYVVLGDYSSERILEVNLDTGSARSISPPLQGISGLALSDDESALYVLDTWNHYGSLYQNGSLSRLDLDTGVLTTIAKGLGNPQRIVVLKGRNTALVTDRQIGRVLSVDLSSGSFQSLVPWGLFRAFGLSLEVPGTSLLVSQRPTYGNYHPDGSVSRVNLETGATQLVAFGIGDPNDLARCDPTGFVGLSHHSGTIRPGYSLPIELRLDALDSPVGDYAATLLVSSNDPVRPRIEIPILMSVTGFPEAETFPKHLSFPETFVGYSSTLPLMIRNTGNDTLHISGLKVEGDYQLIEGQLPGEVKVGESLTVMIAFRPASAGDLSGRLTLLSDDADAPAIAVPLSGLAKIPPRISTLPTSLQHEFTPLTLAAVEVPLTLSNTGGSDLIWSSDAYMLRVGSTGQVAPGPVSGHGGPDAAGYRWRDSDTLGGPIFEWVDIRSVGKGIPLSGPDARSSIPIGFGFPFYQAAYTTLGVSTDGYLTFSTPNYGNNNTLLPSPSAPANLLAMLWHRRSFYGAAQAHYWNDSFRFILQFTDVPSTSSSETETFQAILYRDGRIVYQYLSLPDTQTTGTVGIQNSTRSAGLTVAYNAPYLHDRLAVEISRLAPVLSLKRISGVLHAGESIDVDAFINPTHLTLIPEQHGEIRFFSNDPVQPEFVVPVTLRYSP